MLHNDLFNQYGLLPVYKSSTRSTIWHIKRHKCKKIKDREEKLKKSRLQQCGENSFNTKTADILKMVMNDLSDSAEEVQVARTETGAEAPTWDITVYSEPSI